MVSAWFVIVGVIGVVGGVSMTIFNRPFYKWVAPYAKRVPTWRSILDSNLYQPTASGRVPILMVIGAGWIVIGTVFLSVALTGRT